MSAIPDEGDGVPQVALKVLEKYSGKRGAQVAAVVAFIQVTAPAVQWARRRLDKKEDYTIVVAGIDDVYADLHEWVLARIPETERKALIASTDDQDRVYYDNEDEVEHEKPRVRLRYDGSRRQSLVIDGCKVEVEVNKEAAPGGSYNMPENWQQLLEKIIFTAFNPEGRDAIVRVINGLVAKKQAKKGPPPLLIPSRHGGYWNRRNDLPPRQVKSIVLKQGQMERLVDDLETFLGEEEYYGQVSQPWHRGYLFHGAAGTGKTSVARALANHFAMPLHYLPLGDLEKDADLMSLVSDIKPRSMLLIEDVDAFHAATSREEDDGVVTIAAMLNALDGIWTPHGLITVMTTNHKEALDETLLRAGRVDVDEEFTVLDCEQAERLARWLTDRPHASLAKQFTGRSPVDLIQELRKS